MIQRRQFASLLLAAPFATAGCSRAATTQSNPGQSDFSYLPGIAVREPLIAPQGRRIKVAFAINPGVQVIDLAGPWEVFQDTYLPPDAAEPAFELFTVSEAVQPFRGSGGLMIAPDFSTADAPQPDVIVVPHFDRPRPGTHETSDIHRWIKQAHAHAALTMSVCTGAFQLAKTGLLDGVPMTTNQRAYDNFAKSFPAADLRRGPRFVEAGRIATAGGLSAGIDLAIRVVSRYFGDPVAQETANIMEYVGTGWRPASLAS
ncbi:DJ-1/PfpI domain-containing protein [Sphingomonas antarctica]|uniref:DJ-1/PfpI family protein n=1 Tax=Sphingomonas antarctica TaxID=2040274 RepID=UPI0039ED7D65